MGRNVISKKTKSAFKRSGFPWKAASRWEASSKVEEGVRLSDVERFEAKNKFFTDYPFTEELELDDFFSCIFDRSEAGGPREEPFEEVQSHEYKLWLEQKRRRVKIDYSGYACWRYNPIIFYVDGVGESRRNKHRLVLKDNDEDFWWLHGRDFALMAPITYVGNTNSKQNSRYLYALAFDIDGVEVQQVKNLFYQTKELGQDDEYGPAAHIPMPNLITNSGHGLHLYYLLARPVPLYKENWPLLNRLKFGLTNILWNYGTSTIERPQFQSVHQGFRLPGTKTKFGSIITCWRVEDVPLYTIANLSRWLRGSRRYPVSEADIASLDRKPEYRITSVTRDEAERRWPEWYARVITQKRLGQRPWHVSRAVYDWWVAKLRKDDNGVMVHHRYWCVLTLVAYAVKCRAPEGCGDPAVLARHVTREEAWRDAISLVPAFEALTDSDDNHFTEQDVEDAFRAYDENYCHWPIDTIERTTGLVISRNRRNRRPQSVHLAVARAVRDTVRKVTGKGDWREGNGRKPGQVAGLDSRCAVLVRGWRASHPESRNKSLCARETGLTRPTVAKWWEAELNP